MGKCFLHIVMLFQTTQSKLLDGSVVKLLYAHQEATETTKQTTDFLSSIFESQFSF